MLPIASVVDSVVFTTERPIPNPGVVEPVAANSVMMTYGKNKKTSNVLGKNL